MRAALIQLSSGDDPEANLETTLEFCHAAADAGASLITTPEVTKWMKVRGEGAAPRASQ